MASKKFSKLEVLFGLNPSGFSKGISKVERRLGQMSRKLESAGRGLTVGITAPLALIGGHALKTAIDFETAFAGVRKTTDLSADKLEELRQGIRGMSREMPVAAVEIARVAEAAGRIRGASGDLLGFTKTVIMLAETSNLSAEDAAESLGKIANILNIPAEGMHSLATAISVLGSKTAGSESGIAEYTKRIAGMGLEAGLSTAEILAFGAAAESVGLPVEAGGTAIQKTFSAITEAVETGGEKLDEFARVAGRSSAQFAADFKSGPADAIRDFIAGLKQLSAGENVFAVFGELGQDSERVKRALLAFSNGVSKLDDALVKGSEAIKDQNALWDLYRTFAESTGGELKILRGKFEDVERTLGEALVPVLKELLAFIEQNVLPTFKEWVEGFANLDEGTKRTIVKVVAFTAAIGPALLALGLLVTVVKTLVTSLALLAANPIARVVAGMSVLAITIASAGSEARGAGDSVKVFAGELERLEAAATAADKRLSKFKIDSESLREARAEIEELQAQMRAIGAPQTNDDALILAEFGKQLDAATAKAKRLERQVSGLSESQLESNVAAAKATAIQTRAAEASELLTKKFRINKDELAFLTGELQVARRAFDELAAVEGVSADKLQAHARGIDLIEFSIANLNEERRKQAETAAMVAAEEKRLADIQKENAEVIFSALGPALDMISEKSSLLGGTSLARLQEELSASESAFDAMSDKALSLGLTLEEFGGDKVTMLAGRIRGLREEVDRQSKALEENGGVWGQWAERMSDHMTLFSEFSNGVLQDFTAGIGQAVAQALVYGEDFGDAMAGIFKSLGASIIQTLIDIGIQMLLSMIFQSTIAKTGAMATIGAEAAKTAAMVFSATVAAGGLVGLALAPFAAAGAAALLTATAVPFLAFAEGGLVKGPTLGLVGEAGPELIVPLDRLGDMNLGGAGGNVVTVIEMDGRAIAEVVMRNESGVRRAKLGNRF